MFLIETRWTRERGYARGERNMTKSRIQVRHKLPSDIQQNATVSQDCQRSTTQPFPPTGERNLVHSWSTDCITRDTFSENMNADLQLRVLLIIVEHLMLMRFRVNEAYTDDYRFIHNTETWLFYKGVPQFMEEESTAFTVRVDWAT